MEHPEHIPEVELSAEEFAQQVAQNPVEALRAMRELQNQARQHVDATPSSSSAPSLSAYVGLDSQSLAAIAQIVAQTTHTIYFWEFPGLGGCTATKSTARAKSPSWGMI